MKLRVNWYSVLEVLILGAILFCLAAIGQSQNCPVQGCPTGIHGLVYTGPGNHWDPCSNGPSDPYRAGLFSLDSLTFANDARGIPQNIQYGVLPIYVINAMSGLTQRERSWAWDFLTCDEQHDIILVAAQIAAAPAFTDHLTKTKVDWFNELFVATGCTVPPQPPYENPLPVPRPVVSICTPTPTATQSTPTRTPTQTPIGLPSPSQTPTPGCPVCPSPTPAPTCPPCAGQTPTPGRAVITRAPVATPIALSERAPGGTCGSGYQVALGTLWSGLVVMVYSMIRGH